MPALLDTAAGALFKAALALSQKGNYRRLIECARAPRETQEALLLRILRANAETLFGRRHGFSTVGGLDDYRRAVPVQGYEDLRDLVDRQELTSEACLTAERPVFYQRTSGTTGAPKNIPVTDRGLRCFRRQQRVFAYAQSNRSKILSGSVFGISGQAIEGHMPGGTPFGSASGLIYRSQPRLLRSKYVLPPEVSDIDDYECRYLVIAAFALSEPAVSCLATANPSTLTRLLAVINDNGDLLLDTLSSGRFPQNLGVAAATAGKLRADRNRARSLARVFAGKGAVDYGDIWPDLRGVVTWTGGSCALPLARLQGLVPPSAAMVELGYLASELRGTVNVDLRGSACLPTLNDNLFEFVERSSWEAGGGDFLSLHELSEGDEYYLFVTTPDGLYRYEMNDIVRVDGWLHRTPTLAFVQKGIGVTSITGEKLHEDQVRDAVQAVLACRGVRSDFFIMLADQDAARYALFLETLDDKGSLGPDLAEAIESRLRATNIEYDSKRASGRLLPLQVRRLRAGTGDAYRRKQVAEGQRDAQFKFLLLQYAHNCTFDFASRALSAEH